MRKTAEYAPVLRANFFYKRGEFMREREKERARTVPSGAFFGKNRIIFFAGCRSGAAWLIIYKKEEKASRGVRQFLVLSHGETEIGAFLPNYAHSTILYLGSGGRPYMVPPISVYLINLEIDSIYGCLPMYAKIPPST